MPQLGPRDRELDVRAPFCLEKAASRRSNPQLFPDLLQEPPVRAGRDDLVGRRLDHAELAQTQRLETDRVLGVVLPPAAIGDVVQALPHIVVAGREAAIDQALRDPIGLGGANVGGPHHRAHDALGRDRVAADKIGVADQHAAEILRPWTVQRAVEDHVADVRGRAVPAPKADRS